MGVYGVLGTGLPEDEVQVGVRPKLFAGPSELKNMKNCAVVRLMDEVGYECVP